jgi:hypothetical protein
VIVRQVPHEETHNATHDQTSEELEKPQEVERHARVMRRRGLRTTVKWLEHVGQGCMVFATRKTVVAARALRVLDVQCKRGISFLQRSTLLVWRCLTSVRALSAERVRLGKRMEMME